MFRRKKLFILIPVMLLIPLLLGMTPVKMAHKIANAAPCTQAKQVCCGNNCPFHSTVSHNDLQIGILPSTPLDQEPLRSQEVCIVVPDVELSNFFLNSPPLLC